MPVCSTAGRPMVEKIQGLLPQSAAPAAPHRRHRPPDRADRRHRRACLRRHPQRGAESRPRPHRFRLRLLEQHRRLRYQPDADQLFGEYVELRPRILGRPAQHAPGRRDRHRARDRARLRRRHRAAVAQLAGGAARRRLRGTDPQRAAPAATFVLVQRRTQIAAAIARQRRASRRRYSQQSRPVPAAAGVRPAFWRGAHRVGCCHRRRDPAARVVAPAP